MDWRSLHAYGDRRDEDFYVTALQYGHYLWQHGQTARAILCLDRAMGADLHGREAGLQQFPMPYSALAWFLHFNPPDVFMGNPRVHFQHYADRLREPRREQRRARAWACWAICRLVRPDLSGDELHLVHEPSVAEIELDLRDFGLAKEADLWLGVLTELAAQRKRSGFYATPEPTL